MLSNTFKDYKKNYKSNLSAYLNEYADNNLAWFLEQELKSYEAFNIALDKISIKLKDYSEEELEKLFIQFDLVSDLKKISFKTFKDIIRKESNHIEYDEFNNPVTISIIVNVDFVKLEKYIKSSNLILDFIKKELMLSHNEQFPIEVSLDENTATDVKSVKLEDFQQKELNEVIKSTIKKYLEDIVDDIDPDEYKVLLAALYSYFTTGKFPSLKRPIMFKDVNKKKVGWALKKVYKNIKTGILDIEYFRFAKDNIEIFKDDDFKDADLTNSNIYKYFTTKPTN